MKTMEQLLSNGYYLTDGGLETTLIFHEGIELNHFSSFELILDSEGKAILEKYYRQYLDIARKYNSNFIMETPTWRANHDWGYKLGYSSDELRQINTDSVYFLQNLKNEYTSGHILISGCIGPRGDGYLPEHTMSAEEANDYHLTQVHSLAKAGADLISALTLNYSDEAIGIVWASKIEQIPVVISFTLETDGYLPNGESLREAIEKTDYLTDSYASYYMINCAHPEHFATILKEEGKWKERIAAIRANASTKSHAELDNAEILDAGDSNKLAESYTELSHSLPNMRVAGGCCGTDVTHIQAIAGKWLKASNQMLLVLIMLISVHFSVAARNPEVNIRISTGFDYANISFQDLIFSPFIHSGWYAVTFKIAKEMGVEMFVINDGWVRGKVNEFPNGLRPMIDKINDLGLDFGIWIEPEMVNPNSELYRTNPERAFHYPILTRHRGRTQLLLNLACDVYENLYTSIHKLLKENNMKFIKREMNKSLTDAAFPSVDTDEQ